VNIRSLFFVVFLWIANIQPLYLSQTKYLHNKSCKNRAKLLINKNQRRASDFYLSLVKLKLPLPGDKSSSHFIAPFARQGVIFVSGCNRRKPVVFPVSVYPFLLVRQK
jgi:hypothetical protein